MTAFAIAEYPDSVKKEEDALPSFQELWSEIRNAFESAPKCNLMLENKGVESWNNGLSLRFESEGLRNFREDAFDKIWRPFSKLRLQNNWESLLGDERKSKGKTATATIVRRPFEGKEENACRWKTDTERPRQVTCKRMYFVLSNPYLTNPHEKYREAIFSGPE